MSVVLPMQFVSEIVGLANAFNKKDAVVVQIHPETGLQEIALNQVLVGRLTESVRSAATLLKQHRRFFNLAFRALNNLDADDDDEFVDAIQELARADPDVDDLVQEAALKYFGVHEDDDDAPIAKAFYPVAFDIANQLSTLSMKMRRQYLAKVIETVHAENPELDLGMYEFIAYYTKDYPLVQLVFPNIPAWAIAEQEADAQHPTFQFAYQPIEAFNREDDLNVFKWANRNEKNRVRWLSVVSGRAMGEKEQQISD
jgi:hypothetical protein